MSRTLRFLPDRFNLYLYTAVAGSALLFLLAFGGCAGGKGGGKRADISLASIEGIRDTVEFHIGSPLFLQMKINTGQACEPFNGHPFFFDERGAQVGWGFEEVSDSLLFPDAPAGCERYIFLSSESSNLLAEGYYPMSVALLIDEKSEFRSDTLVLHPIHASGANSLSYSRFILEQIITGSPLLDDPGTLRELFSSHLPQSFASDVYQGVILYRGGDIEGAKEALQRAETRANASSSTQPSENGMKVLRVLKQKISGEGK